MERIRRHFIFYGYVQGVGFRYKARHAAERFGIAGWVRNLGDGSVEMEAEGSPNDISALITALNDYSWGSIERFDADDVPVEGGYSFEIR